MLAGPQSRIRNRLPKKYNYAANLVYIVALCCAKCSMSLLLARLARFTRARRASHAISGLAVGWAAASLAVVGRQCSGPRPWDTQDLGGRCLGFVRATPPTPPIFFLSNASIYVVSRAD